MKLENLGRFSIWVILVFLYYGSTFRNWHNIEELRNLVVRIATFGIFTGLSVSFLHKARPFTNNVTKLYLFFCSVPATSNVLLILSFLGGLGFAGHTDACCKASFYDGVAIVSILGFGFIAIGGLYISTIVSEELITLFGVRNKEWIVTLITSIIGLVGTVTSALLGH